MLIVEKKYQFIVGFGLLKAFVVKDTEHYQTYPLNKKTKKHCKSLY